MDVDAAPVEVAAAPVSGGAPAGAAPPTFGFKNLDETKREVFARHAHEWKQMKAQVATLKRERKKIPKKGNKEKKKAVSKEIRKLIADLREKQQKEMAAYGLSGKVAVPAGLDDDGDEDL